MKLTRILTVFLIASPAFAAHSEIVEPSAPGQLRDCVASPENETELTVKGTINAADLFFIASRMPALTSLNLSECSIAACDGVSQPGAAASYAAGVIPAGVFAGSKLENVTLPLSAKTEIGDMAFCGSGLRNVTIGPNITAIGTGAFSACPSLENVSIGVTCSLGSHIFADCAALSEADVTGCDSIAGSMFARCAALSAVKGAENLVSVGDNAFANCVSLKAFDFGKKLKNIGEGAFASSGLETADLAACESLRNIGDWAFAGCLSLMSAEFPADMTGLGRGVFFDCKNLGAFVLPASADTVGDYALKGMSAVEELNLPAGLSQIGTLAMSGMDGLKAIYAEDIETVPALGNDVWDRLDKSNITLTVATDKAEDFKAAPQWQDFTILTTTLSAPSVIADRSSAKISGRFDGSFLYVRCEGDKLRDVRIYDLAGRYLAGVSPESETAVIDCGRLEGKVFIVEAYTVTGLRAAVKLSRNMN